MIAFPSLFDVLPRADDLVNAILMEYAHAVTPLSAFDVSRNIRAKHDDRWLDGTVRTRISALKNAGMLREVDREGRHRNRPCTRYVRCV